MQTFLSFSTICRATATHRHDLTVSGVSVCPSVRPSVARAVKQRISEPSHELCSIVDKLLWSKYVYDSKCRRRFYRSTNAPKRTEQNLVVRIGKSVAEVTSN